MQSVRWLLRCSLMLAVFAGTWVDAVAADGLTTPWSKGFHSRVRLTAANLLGQTNEMTLYAGVDIRLDKNWKTYWTSPGDNGGIPPEFNWSRSQNVKSVRVMYPAPKRISDETGISIGYKDQVLFPVAITPTNPLQPVKLHMTVFYGVCDDICIPAEASLQLSVAPGARATIPVQRALLESLSRVPVAAMPTLKVARATAVLAGKKPHLLITTQSTRADSRADMFAVSRSGDYLPVPKAIEHGPDGQTTFRIDLKHMGDPSSLSSKTLDLTVVDDGRGITVPWVIESKDE